jgi:hypothetical protein
MATMTENQALTPEQKRYKEYMTTGDDFTRIDIYRSAAAWYRKALDVRPGNEEAGRKLAEIKEKIKKENKAIYVIVAVMAMVAVLVWAMA